MGSILRLTIFIFATLAVHEKLSFTYDVTEKCPGKLTTTTKFTNDPNYIYCINIAQYFKGAAAKCNGQTTVPASSPVIYSEPPLNAKRMIAVQLGYIISSKREKLYNFMLAISTVDHLDRCLFMDYKLLNVSPQMENCTVHKATTVFYVCYVLYRRMGPPDRNCSLSYENWNFSDPKSCAMVPKSNAVVKSCAITVKFAKEVSANSMGKIVKCNIPNEIKNAAILQRCPCRCKKDEKYKTVDDTLCDCKSGFKYELSVYYEQDTCEPIPIITNSSTGCNQSCVINGTKDVCVYTNWTNFTACAKCNVSTKSRYRSLNLTKLNEHCVKPEQVEKETVNCSKSFTDCETCQIYYESNSIWSQCNQTCGFGVMTRKVAKVNVGQDALKRCTKIKNGIDESRRCPGIPCPEDCVYTEWTHWTECNVTCNNGTRSRNRTLLVEESYGGNCTKNITFEDDPCVGKFRECQQNCKYSDWSVSKCPKCRSKWQSKLTDKISRTILVYSTSFADERCDVNTLVKDINCSQNPCFEPDFDSMDESDKRNVVAVVAVLGVIVVLIIVGAVVFIVFSKRRQSQKLESEKSSARQKSNNKKSQKKKKEPEVSSTYEFIAMDSSLQSKAKTSVIGLFSNISDSPKSKRNTSFKLSKSTRNQRAKQAKSESIAITDSKAKKVRNSKEKGYRNIPKSVKKKSSAKEKKKNK